MICKQWGSTGKEEKGVGRSKNESVVCKQWGPTGKEDECERWDGEFIVKSKREL